MLAVLSQQETTGTSRERSKTMSGMKEGSQTVSTRADDEDNFDSIQDLDQDRERGKRSSLYKDFLSLFSTEKRVPNNGGSIQKTLSVKNNSSQLSWQRLEMSKDGKPVLPYQEISELFPRAGEPKQRILVAKWLEPPKHWEKEEVVIKWRSKKFAFEDDRRKWEHMMKALHYAHLQDPLDFKIKGLGRILGLYECDTAFHVVMEKIQGEDLFCFFENARPFSALRNPEYSCHSISRVIEGVLLGLQKLHALGMVHRDLKLENCVAEGKIGLNTEDFSIKIIDFDTCSFSSENEVFVQVLGTDQYIAPESFLGKCLPKSDAFAVGVCVYTLMTGCYPYQPILFNDLKGENFVGHPKMETIRKKMRMAKLDFGKKIWEENPDAVDFVKKLMAFEYEKRMSVDEALAHEFIVKRRSMGSSAVCRKRSPSSPW